MRSCGFAASRCGAGAGGCPEGPSLVQRERLNFGLWRPSRRAEQGPSKPRTHFRGVRSLYFSQELFLDDDAESQRSPSASLAQFLSRKSEDSQLVCIAVFGSGKVARVYSSMFLAFAGHEPELQSDAQVLVVRHSCWKENQLLVSQAAESTATRHARSLRSHIQLPWTPRW